MAPALKARSAGATLRPPRLCCGNPAPSPMAPALKARSAGATLRPPRICCRNPAPSPTKSALVKMSGNPPQEDKKPGVQSASYINLKVKGEDGNEVFLRINRSTQLHKLMNAYCYRQSVDVRTVRFLFDGSRLRGNQTPDELKMEDGDEIDAMVEATGGGVNGA